MNHSDTAVIVTSYCGEPNPDKKRHMTKTLCKNLKEQGLFVCLASHSTIDEETQKYCDVFVYDKDNTFSVGGIPSEGLTHGVAELTSLHNAINSLQRFGFKNIVKVTFDVNPTIDFVSLIDRSKAHEKKLVSPGWGISITTVCFFVDIEFFKILLPLNVEVLSKFSNKTLEEVLFDMVNENNLNENYQKYDSYESYVKVPQIEFSHGAGRNFSEYNFE
jgi:organic radical activating enzyme